jgi:hypothetical protein
MSRLERGELGVRLEGEHDGSKVLIDYLVWTEWRLLDVRCRERMEGDARDLLSCYSCYADAFGEARISVYRTEMALTAFLVC